MIVTRPITTVLEADIKGYFDAIVRDLLVEDLSIEDDLDDEVRELLLEYEDEIDKGRLEYHKMFKLVKDKLIRERNLIL